MQQETLQELLSKYLQHCSLFRNYTPQTIKGYEATFKLFLKETRIKSPEDMNRNMLEEWFLNGRLNRKWSACTFLGYHKHLNTFMKWLVNRKVLEENYLDEIEKPKLEHKLPRTLSKEEATKILETVFHLPYFHHFGKYRNRALIAIMLLAGLRRQEVINLKFNDVSLETRTIFINQGKGHKDRIIPANQKLQLILSEYIQQRRKHKRESISFFVNTQKDIPIGEHAIANLIRRLRNATAINFSAHTLRHAFARLMLEGGCDIYTLSKIMGHNKITTTTIYLSCSNQQMGKSIEMHSLN